MKLIRDFPTFNYKNSNNELIGNNYFVIEHFGTVVNGENNSQNVETVAETCKIDFNDLLYLTDQYVLNTFATNFNLTKMIQRFDDYRINGPVQNFSHYTTSSGTVSFLLPTINVITGSQEEDSVNYQGLEPLSLPYSLNYDNTHHNFIIPTQENNFNGFETYAYREGDSISDDTTAPIIIPIPTFSEENFFVNRINNFVQVKLQDWDAKIVHTKGNIVYHNDKIYICTVNESLSDEERSFSLYNWTEIGSGGDLNNYFTPEKHYKVGEFVIYDSNLYARKTEGRDLIWIPENWILLTNGKVASIFIKYSHNEPIQDEDLHNTPDNWMGISYGDYSVAPVHYDSYLWYKIKGDDVNINLEADSMVINCTLQTNSWEVNNNIFTYTLNNTTLYPELNYITSLSRPIVDVELPNSVTDWDNIITEYNKIQKVETGRESITFYAQEKPNQDITVKIRISGDINENSFVNNSDYNQYKEDVEIEITRLENKINNLAAEVGEANSILGSVLNGG